MFLFNVTLWQMLVARIKSSRHVDAAIAYFGQGGARLLPLRAGDRLVVDMSPGTVRAGATDPREIEILINRGVRPFTRRHLHAKVVIGENWAIAGSANVSKYAFNTLDEAAVLVTDRTVVRRAREFVDRLCTEPIRANYLEECKKIYRPPRRPTAVIVAGAPQRTTRLQPAKLWLVNLREEDIPEHELSRFQSGKKRATRLVKDKTRSTIDSFWYASKPRIAKELELGDWIIEIYQRKDGSKRVYAPGQFLMLDVYGRKSSGAKKRYVFHLEVPKRGQSYTWGAFRRVARSIWTSGQMTRPRTTAIRDSIVADRLLSLWTPAGYITKGNAN